MKNSADWLLVYPALLIVSAAVANCAEKIGKEQNTEQRRQKMVLEQIVRYGIKDRRVIEAMSKVPRHLFVSESQEHLAYEDQPVPIGHGQTISQPYMVALMTELAELDCGDIVLEIGTGSGYQAAVASLLARRVYTIEYIEALGLEAKGRLEQLKFDNVEVRIGDGYQGWPEHQPFDAILVTAAIDHVPQPLLQQLNQGGKMVIPLGSESETQRLLVLEKDLESRITQREVIPVRFVPFLGPRGKPPR